ncbi:uncharacterized protein LOC122252746 [Penaeus japonicus]|uniref:uncharacterized protein LOC122252746 n=1 Tax=Penaeus japonicus TaxID=27405 RepID=UPI001C714CD1|nr:uncharacterized protein LOC122252746 [Penaeus japonicus]
MVRVTTTPMVLLGSGYLQQHLHCTLGTFCFPPSISSAVSDIALRPSPQPSEVLRAKDESSSRRLFLLLLLFFFVIVIVVIINVFFFIPASSSSSASCSGRICNREEF